jgi:hypothetical protein
MLTEDGLPPDAAERLRSVARARTEGSVPYPRLATAIRRDRRRRAAGGVALGVAAVLAATFVTSAVRADRPTVPSNRGTGPTPTQTPTPPGPTTPDPTPSRLPESGPDGDPFDFTGRTAGGLGSDTAWIQGLRQRVFEAGEAADAAHTKVLWATDYQGRRFALTLGQRGGNWSVGRWQGPAGAAPDAMSPAGSEGIVGTGPSGPQFSDALQFRPDDDGPGFLVAFGPRLADVEVAAAYDYTADGRQRTTWRPLEPDAGVWVVEVAKNEMDVVGVRARAADGSLARIGGRRSYQEGEPRVDMAGVTPAGIPRNVVACAQLAFASEAGGFPAGSTPILAGAPKVGAEWYGIAVARAPGGGYLVGSCPTLNPQWSTSRASESPEGFVVPAPAGGPEALFVLVPTNVSVVTGNSIRQDPAAVVIAPVGATEIEVAGTKAPVRDRLAIVTGVPADGATAIARDANGRELGRTGAARDAMAVAREAFPG